MIYTGYLPTQPKVTDLCSKQLPVKGDSVQREYMLTCLTGVTEWNRVDKAS